MLLVYAVNLSAFNNETNCMSLEDQQNSKERTDHWYNMIIENGRESVKAQLGGSNRDMGHGQHITLALERYDREQQDMKDAVRDERENETLEIARTAGLIAKKSVAQSKLAIIIAFVAAVAAVVTAVRGS